jgi:D-glycero-alpha-D-manno-heptose 1-phosphate guanylyltransferase
MFRVVILAGGFGTRVKHLLPGLPKPMAPVCGRPFVEWVVRFFARYGMTDFVLSTGHLSEVLEGHFATQPVPQTTVTCRAEREPLGTAGGFLNATLGSSASDTTTWVVVNGDSLVFVDPRPLIEQVSSGRAEAGILGLSMDDASRYGTLDISADGHLRAFQEKRAGAGIINAGVYVFSNDSVRNMPPQRPLSFEFDVFPGLAKTGRVAVQSAPAGTSFLDIGTPETLAAAEQFIATHQSQF